VLNQRINESDEALSQKMAQDSKNDPDMDNDGPQSQRVAKQYDFEKIWIILKSLHRQQHFLSLAAAKHSKLSYNPNHPM